MLPFLVGNAKIFVLERAEKNLRFKSLPAPKKTPTAWSREGHIKRYGQQDLNLHGLPPEPKSGASANSAMPAKYMC